MGKKRDVLGVLAENLSAFMKLKNFDSEPQLEKKSKVAQKTINNILHQRHQPKLDSIEKLAGALGVSVYHLLLPTEDEKFLAVCLAWEQSDERGREDLRDIAVAILKKRNEAGADTATATVHRPRNAAS